MSLKRDLRGPTKRTLEAIETKNKLFCISIKLFSKYGYEAVTIDDITEKAGVSKGTFYTHFTTKDAVLVEQFNKIDDAYTKAFENIDGKMSIGEELLLLIETMCDYCNSECGVNVMKIVYMNQIGIAEHPVILKKHKRPFYTLLEHIVEKGKKTGEFSKGLNTKNVVMFLARSAHALIYDWCLYDGNFDLPAEGKRYFSIIIGFLKEGSHSM
ncbi:MAG: TetR/AcrR family transcriptional regulator [Treponema sp.]|jgi:AcrR family transcriptional regulator|nr:TetR/AcrR family transcriptional regulator [Treponema sp.]